MKLLRFVNGEEPKLGVLDGDVIVPLDSLKTEFPTMLSIIAGGDDALSKVKSAVAAESKRITLGSVRLIAPIEKPGKYLAIGMNFRKHAEEAKKLGDETPTNQY